MSEWYERGLAGLSGPLDRMSPAWAAWALGHSEFIHRTMKLTAAQK